MIALSRSQARAFRAVLRRCATHADYRRDPILLARAGPMGVRLEAVLTETALCLELPGRHDPSRMAFPVSLFARIEGSSDDLVTLEEIKPGQGRATWTADDAPRSQEFATVAPDPHLSFPAAPARLADPGDYFLLALADAGRTAAKQMAGRNLHRVLLRGSKGEVVATDGHQLLVQGGFRFPWQDDLLLPRLDVWGSRELPDGAKVGVGRAGKHLFIRIGPWTVALLADPEARFPPYEGIVPAPKDVTTRLQLSLGDVALLKKELPRLPGAKDSAGSVTLDIGKQGIQVRADAAGKAAAAVELAGAKSSGPAAVVAMDRKPLLRALKLGFRAVEIVHPDRPLCCRDARRVFVWMPLTEPAAPAPPAAPQKEITSVPPPSNGQRHGEPPAAGPPSGSDPLVEAEAIRDLLGAAQSRLSRLVAVLKQHRRQAKAVQAAVQSLRHLPPLTP